MIKNNTSITIATLAIILISGNVFADDPRTQVFPPINCSPSELKVISWQNGNPNTICLSGQDVLRLAIPTCANEQYVSYINGRFQCADIALKTVPPCAANEVLTSDGNSLSCTPSTSGSIKGCHIVTANKKLTTEKGTGKARGAVEALCPAGELAVSGGCESDRSGMGDDEATDPMVISSYPTDANGWYCSATNRPVAYVKCCPLDN